MQVSDYKLLVIVKASEWLLTYRERMIYMFLQEIKEMFKSKVLIAGLIVAILIPTLYSATFLWAFWNPYDYTENLKVAVVNEDQPVSIEDRSEERRVGKERRSRTRRERKKESTKKTARTCTDA